MLDPKNNRLFYDALLKAPDGYVFDHAVTTSYSLDLEAILLIPIALFFSEDFDFNAHQTRDDLIESLTQASNHISIFCQRGKIQVPSPYNKLIAFWEKGIYQIQMPNYDQSFHPKVWVIRYLHNEKKGPAFYRFLCTSRNLTFSRDWDLAISSEGFVDDKQGTNNTGITDMLGWLDRQNKKVIPAEFFKEIPRVNFDIPAPFSSIRFHPIGISQKHKNPITEQSLIQDERLVMSPFLKEDTLCQLSEKSRELYLFSCSHELSRLSLDLWQDIEPYKFSPFIEDAEKMDGMSEADEIPMSQNLHAKFFIDKKGNKISWYLGSANASRPASEGNIEFMVQLDTTTRAMSPSKIKEKLIAGMGNDIALFEPFTGESIVVDQCDQIREQEIRKLIHALSDLQITGKAEKNQSNLFDLIIYIPQSFIKIPTDIIVRIKPLPEKHRPSITISPYVGQEIRDFTGFEETELSPYLIIELWDGEKLIHQFLLDMKIELDNNRLNKIFNSIINSKARFLNYLFFLISDETPDPHDEQTANKNAGANYGDEIAFFANTPIYEKLLYTASRKSKKLDSINKLVERLKNEQDELGEPIITKEFLDMWAVFHSFATKK